MAKMTLEERIAMSLQKSAAKVYLRQDFDKFGGYDQVGRALRAVMRRGLLVKAGYGVYVKARPSSLTGKPVPVVPLVEIGLAALTKLGIEPVLGSAAQDYMAGKTTQMPLAVVLNVGKSRVSRRLGIAAQAIRYGE